MTILSFPKKTLFLLGGLLLIIILLFLTVLIKPSPSPSVPSSPTPTPLAPQGDADVLERQGKLRKEQFPLIDFTPYQTPDFAITYVGPLSLKISLYAEDKAAAKEKALFWIKTKSIDPSSHQIIWEDFSASESATPQP